MDITQLIPIAMTIGVIYFLIIRPENLKRAEHDKMLAALAKDDRVVTNAGIHGRVVSVQDKTLAIEVAKGVQVTIDRDAVGRKVASDKEDGK